MTIVLTLVGLVVGAIWAIESFAAALLTLVVAMVGFVIGLALEGRIDLDLRGGRDDS